MAGAAMAEDTLLAPLLVCGEEDAGVAIVRIEPPGEVALAIELVAAFTGEDLTAGSIRSAGVVVSLIGIVRIIAAGKRMRHGSGGVLHDLIDAGWGAGRGGGGGRGGVGRCCRGGRGGGCDVLAVEVHDQRHDDGYGYGNNDQSEVLLHVVNDVMMQPLALVLFRSDVRVRGGCALGRGSVEDLTIGQFCMHRRHDCGKDGACLRENTGGNRVSYI